MNSRPKVVSLFCGAGGSSLGYLWAGFDCLGGVDFDDDCLRSYELNFGHDKVFKADISRLSGDELLERFLPSAEQLSLIDASPPCQGFSLFNYTLGKGISRDPRNFLLFHAARLIEEVRPNAFVIENVVGLASKRGKPYLIKVRKQLEHAGYQVAIWILDASFFGVPQARRRIFIVGGINFKPSPPSPEKRTTISDVVRELESCHLNGGTMPSATMFVDAVAQSNALKTKATPMLDFVSRKRRGTRCSIAYFKHHIMKNRLKLNCPSPTIVTTANSWPLHWRFNRTITLEEATVLCSFPASFKFAGSLTSKVRQIGNCVPPKMIQAIAKSILPHLLTTSEGTCRL